MSWPATPTTTAIVVGFVFVTLIVMETEKGVRRYLASLGEDTDDRNYGYFDDIPSEDEKGQGASASAVEPRG